MIENKRAENTGLYDPSFEHDNCGIGAVVNIKGIKTHDTVNNALKIVENLEHRAGKDAEGKTGDGVGILLQISHKFFTKALAELGYDLGKEGDYGIGMFFFPQKELARKQAMKMFEVIVEKEGLEYKNFGTFSTDAVDYPDYGHGVHLLERGSYNTWNPWQEGNRCHAMHHAGIHQKT